MASFQPADRRASEERCPRFQDHERAGSLSLTVDQRAKREREKIGRARIEKMSTRAFRLLSSVTAVAFPARRSGRPGSDSRGVLKRARRARALSTASRFGRRRSRPTPRPAPKLEQSRNRPIGLPVRWDESEFRGACRRPISSKMLLPSSRRHRRDRGRRPSARPLTPLSPAPSNPRGAQGLIAAAKQAGLFVREAR